MSFDSYSKYILYRAVIGSRAYGLSHAGSDLDLRGFFLPPARLHWSLSGVPEQLEKSDADECYWELGKFLQLALKANPSILEALYTPVVEFATPLAQELLDMKKAFLSKRAYGTYNGYARSQFHKLEQDQRRGEVRWKHAMHLARLLLSGITLFEEGRVLVDVEAYREKLLAIRNGQWTWDELAKWRGELHQRFDEAYAKTTIPDEPETSRVNEFLLRARRQAVDLE